MNVTTPNELSLIHLVALSNDNEDFDLFRDESKQIKPALLSRSTYGFRDTAAHFVAAYKYE